MNSNDIKRDLFATLAYLQLMTSLDVGKSSITNPTIKSSLENAFDFYSKADERQMKLKGKTLIKTLKPLVNHYKTFAPPKCSIAILADEFNSLFQTTNNPYTYGIDYGWLNKRINCSKLGFPVDLPEHARIGIGHHSGRISVEEHFLLDDAFLMLISAEESFSDMISYANKQKAIVKSKSSEIMDKLQYINHDVAAYSRLSVISFFSFVEAFVNSIGFEFILLNDKALNTKDREILSGKKSARYFALEKNSKSSRL